MSTEVVCMSPGSKQLYITRVKLGNGTAAIEGEFSSETSVAVREEVRAIYMEVMEEQTSTVSREAEDIAQYENKLRKANLQNQNIKRMKKPSQRGSKKRNKKRSRSPRR